MTNAISILQGPLQDMGEVELQHWLRCAAARAGFSAASRLHTLLDTFGERSQPLQASYEVRPWPCVHRKHMQTAPSSVLTAADRLAAW